ncbi:MAG: GEVED domain-containing protein [Bacteroidales bacterium]|nr:GEVED domain-containing protein [Bacteroidales bacterium]
MKFFKNILKIYILSTLTSIYILSFYDLYSQNPCSNIISITLGTTYNGTLSGSGNDWNYYSNCVWNMLGDEVVYSFTAPSSGYYLFNMSNVSGEPDFFLMSSCNPNSTNLFIDCVDYGQQTIYLTAGQTVYLIIDNYYSTLSASYSFVVTSVTPPSNDECNNAITLSVTASCSYSTYSNQYASNSAGIPDPGCGNYLGGDVWFKLTVPSTGHVILDTDDGTLTDGAMAIYTGTCASLTLLECDDDDSPNGLMPMIDRSGLTPGSTLYIRFWEYGNNNNGSFGICAYDPALGPCASITNIPSCGTSVTATIPSGSGQWNGQICGVGTPGNERVYSFTPATTAPYYLVVSSASGAISYGYQANNCAYAGWTCIGNISSPGSYGPFNLTAGTTYYILLDNGNATTSTHTFSIRCPETPGNYLHPTQGLQGTYLGSCMVNTCTGTYTDDGGASGNYSNNVNSIYRTFCPNSRNKCLRATINSMDIEGTTTVCYDYLIIRNGPTQGSPILWAGCYTLASPTTIAGSFTNPFVSTNSSGCLTFQFYSNSSINRPGWNITFDCVDCAQNSQMNNDCITSTPICGTTSFSGSSIGPGITSTCGGCELSENFSNWYYFQITNDGKLYVDIKPNNLFDDYDFALFKSNNCSNLGDPIRCTYAALTDYCSSTVYYYWYNNDCSSAQGRRITNVTFNTLNKSSSCESFSRNISSIQTTVTKGNTYNLSVTVAGGNKCYIRALFDWNKNMSLADAGEAYIVASNVGAGTYSINITIPSTARVGQTLMRITVGYDGFIPNCGASAYYGEVEDYLIFITDGTHCSNNIKDADEVGTDCGGVDCVPCTAQYWPTNTGMNSTETDFSEDVTGNSWVQGVSVTAGETYYLLINNWSPGGGGFDIIWNFQEGGAMNCDIVLPIELLYFRGNLIDNKVKLEWATASEVNNNHFIVLKSYDAIIFKEIANIKGKGNSNQINYYEAYDNEPVDKVTYYRLKQVDNDGNFAFSEIIAIVPDFSKILTNYKIYEDIDNITFTLISIPGISIMCLITDITGRILYENNFVVNKNAMYTFSINKQSFSKGIYFISIFDGYNFYNEKFIN